MTMNNPTTPGAWANLISGLWGRDNFPINVKEVAKGISENQPDPIKKIAGTSLDGFEGGLFLRKKSWFIVYNDEIQSEGRINFTIGHELGHYLLHRQNEDNFECGTDDVTGQNNDARKIEFEADKFSAMLLMPCDDFRRQVDPRHIDLHMISACAERYGVSLLAALRQWIELNQRRAVMVISRQDKILWSWSTKKAMKTQSYFRFGKEKVFVPRGTLASSTATHTQNQQREGIELPANIWFPNEPAGMTAREMRIVSDQYNFVISLIVMPDRDPWEKPLDEDPLLIDTYTNFINNGQNPY